MTILSDEPLGDDSQIPRPALILGAAGAIPFLAGGTIALIVTDAGWNALAVDAVRFYGAVILSFLGGIRWGFAIQPLNKSDMWLQLTISVTPSLLAWVALLMPQSIGIGLLIIGFLGMLALDLQFVSQGRAPRWFSKLRTGLTVCACLGLLMITF